MTVPAVPVIPAPAVDIDRLRRYRLARVVDQMVRHDVALVVLLDPVSLRYAADWREYALYQSHIQTYTLFVHPDGRLVLHGAYATDHPTISDFRPTHALNSFDGGLDPARAAARFAADVEAAAGDGARVAVEQVNPSATIALEARGLTVVDAEPLVEQARFVKSADEIACIRHSIAVAEAAMDAMRAALRPGVTENELLAVLHHVNVANDGDWIDGRMLCSGPRTNPWYQMATHRRVEDGDLLAFDTDMVGPFGYTADISRTWLVGPRDPAPDQRDRYQRAHAEITANAELLEPGRTFRELSEKSFRQPPEFLAHRYTCLAHGVGLTDEYPRIPYPCDWADSGYDGELQVGNVLTVESFVGSDRGGPGVKLEDMYLVTGAGPERLSAYPFEEALLS